MALYSYSCVQGHHSGLRVPVAERDLPLPCPECAAPLRREFARILINMRGATSGDEITEWQFKNLDDKTWSKSREI